MCVCVHVGVRKRMCKCVSVYLCENECVSESVCVHVGIFQISGLFLEPMIFTFADTIPSWLP